MTEATPFSRIIAIVKERELSESAACELAGLNRSTLAVGRRNNGNLQLPTIQAFAKGLNLPLAELLGEPSGSGGGAQQPPLYRLIDIHPSPLNPRKSFDEAAIIELALSIAAQGLLQNLVLRPRAEGGYWIVAGERRYRALCIWLKRIFGTRTAPISRAKSSKPTTPTI
jgi:hypothetical protein